ncbi:unnamed protein product, partial [Ectocarpus sp. 4 AP-2014]
GEYGTALEANIVNAVDRDLSLVAAAAGRASDKLRTRFPHSTPVGDFAQMDIPRIETASFDHTRRATDDLTGVHQQALMASLTGNT